MSPPSLRCYNLLMELSSHWRVQGNVGADKDYPDKVRGALNEGGLYGEVSPCDEVKLQGTETKRTAYRMAPPRLR